MRYLTTFALLVFSAIGAKAQFENFAFTDYSGGKVFLVVDGEIKWEHAAPQSNDLWVLESGNILFTTGKGVLEMTQANDTVFEYRSTCGVFGCQRLENGNTFIAECDKARFLEVSPTGEIVKEVSIMPQGRTNAGGAFMRNARRLDNGNYLVAHYGPQMVAEYNDKGEMVWSAQVKGGAHSATRLANGNTLVAVADMTRNSRLIEFDPQSNVVWEMTNQDLGGELFKFLGGIHYIDGTIMVANWLGHGQEGNSSHIFLIDKQTKAIIDSFDSHQGVKTVSSVFRYKEAAGAAESAH